MSNLETRGLLDAEISVVMISCRRFTFTWHALPALVLPLVIFGCVLSLSVTLARAVTLEEEIKAIAADARGHVGAAAMIVETGKEAAFNESDHFPMQSVYKLPIAMAVLARIDRGELKLDQSVHVTEFDLAPPPVHSPFRDSNPHADVDVPIRELLRLTMCESDGTTSDVLMRLGGGAAEIQAYLRGIGVDAIAIATTEKEMAADHAVQYRNWGTPDGLVRLLALLQTGRGLSATSREFLLELMTASKPGAHRIKGLLPPKLPVAHKTGTSGTAEGVTAACNDVGLIALPSGKHLAVAVFVSDSPADESVREGVIARIARAAWDWATPTPRE